MITQVLKELVTLPVELFVQDKELASKLEKGLETTIDTVGLFTGDFSSLFPGLEKDGVKDASSSAQNGPAGPQSSALPAEHLRWMV